MRAFVTSGTGFRTAVVDGLRLRICALWATAVVAGCGQSGQASGGTGQGGTTTTTSDEGTSSWDYVCEPPPQIPCLNPQPWDVGGPTGFVRCEQGWLHRETPQPCPPPPGPACDPMGSAADCVVNTDCQAAPNGACVYRNYDSPPIHVGCNCIYGCVTDTDCGAGQVCVCDSPVPYCVPATCIQDSDCADGYLCAVAPESRYGDCAYDTLACQKPDDECMCAEDCNCDAYWCTTGIDHRHCDSNGRPFLVDGEARVAGLAHRGDWRAAGVAPQTADLPADVRAVLAKEWAACGQMEHASIAAFARFMMQLLSLGAPPDLVAAAASAMNDETAHATIAFALASAYAGERVGPGRLPISGSLDVGDPAEIVRLTILEGCIGETVAAALAGEAAVHARDPAVRAALARIAEDEARHAELAWRFVRWAVDRDVRLAAFAERVFAGAIAAERAVPSAIDAGADAAWLHHGIVRGAARADVRRRVMDHVIAPSARGLFEMAGAKNPVHETGA